MLKLIVKKNASNDEIEGLRARITPEALPNRRSKSALSDRFNNKSIIRIKLFRLLTNIFAAVVDKNSDCRN